MTLPPVLLLGFGKMGGAMAAGWHDMGLAPSWAIDPNGADLRDVRCVGRCRRCAGRLHPGRGDPCGQGRRWRRRRCRCWRAMPGRAVFLSIMAGRTLAGLAGMLGESAAIVRAMPNTPAAIRQGITVACAGPNVVPAQRDLCDTLLRAIGSVAWTQEEGQLDAVDGGLRGRSSLRLPAGRVAGAGRPRARAASRPGAHVGPADCQRRGGRCLLRARRMQALCARR